MTHTVVVETRSKQVMSVEQANFLIWWWERGPGYYEPGRRRWSERDQWTFWRERCRINREHPGSRAEHRRVTHV